MSWQRDLIERAHDEELAMHQPVEDTRALDQHRALQDTLNRKYGGNTPIPLGEINTGCCQSVVKASNPKDAIGSTKVGVSSVSMPVLAEIAMALKTLHGGDQHPFHYLPMPVVMEFGIGMLEGAIKYRRHNYRVIGVRASVYIDATFRHLSDLVEGQEIDEASGMSHVTKAGTSLCVMRDAMIRDKMVDDRPPGTHSYLEHMGFPHKPFNQMSVTDLVHQAFVELGLWWEGGDRAFIDHRLHPIVAALALFVEARRCMINGNDIYINPDANGAFIADLNPAVSELLAKYPEPKEPYLAETEPDEYSG